ncbi:hypothetical protein ARMSODRAFT_777762 [Armillaria solidipes]|uniref:Uncharacterized protein n=1 Tax=Armillaria solidipes TaxID=1076256 RepID=A0A2H3B0F6_9AGAR|nr:hypothetical protein ARMSODRAFT_777762 [Armillaria solidipes]
MVRRKRRFSIKFTYYCPTLVNVLDLLSSGYLHLWDRRRSGIMHTTRGYEALNRVTGLSSQRVTSRTNIKNVLLTSNDMLSSLLAPRNTARCVSFPHNPHWSRFVIACTRLECLPGVPISVPRSYFRTRLHFYFVLSGRLVWGNSMYARPRSKYGPALG